MLEICHFQQEQIQRLRDDIARLKGKKPTPKITPSTLENTPRNQGKGPRLKQRH